MFTNASKSNINSTFASVNDQSGFRSGAGGFAVNAAGNTTLTGGVITSTQTAVDNNANRFTAGGRLTITDVANTASYNGNAASVSVSISAGTAKDKNNKDILTPGGSFGFGSTGGNASSTSSGGISGRAGNTSLRTGGANTGLTRIFNQPEVQKELDAQVAITGAFTQQLGPIVGRAVMSLLERMTTPEQNPTPARPTPAADKMVQSDQDMRAGFAAIANSSDLKDPEKEFFADVAKVYTANTHIAGLVKDATDNPVAYQQSVAPMDDDMVDPSANRDPLATPVALRLGPGKAGTTPAGADAAANAWATSQRDGGLVYDPQADTYRSASGGVISGERLRGFFSDQISGAASGLQELFSRTFRGTAAFIQIVTGGLPTGTTSPIAVLQFPNNTGNTSPPPVASNNTGGNQTLNPATGTAVGGGFAAGEVIQLSPLVYANPKPPTVVEPITNSPQQPDIPSDWISRPGKEPGSVIYFPPGTSPSDGGEHIRVMPPGSSGVADLNANGYWVRVNPYRQTIDPSTGRPARGRGDSHVPLPPTKK